MSRTKPILNPFPTPDAVTDERQRRTRMRDPWRDPVVQDDGAYNPFDDSQEGQRQRAEYRAVHDFQWAERESRRLAAEQAATFSGQNEHLKVSPRHVAPMHVHPEGSAIARRQGYGRKLY